MLNELLQSDMPKILLEEIRAKDLDFEIGQVPRHFVRISQNGIVSFVEIPDTSPIITLERSPSGVLSQKKDMINYSNGAAARMFGYESLVGVPSIDLVPERHRHNRNQVFEEVLRTGIPITIETQRIHRKGYEIDIVAQLFRYKPPLGRYDIAAIIKRR